jgi:hypothetical protein
MAIDINIESQVSQTITDGVTDKAPSENAVFDALANKVDKETGKGLSEEDFTMAEKNKLAGIEAGAEVNVNADWNATTGDAQILNKPTIPDVTLLVPYTGAVADVDLGTHKLTAKDLVVNHPSGSGDAATITKGGNGEALKVVKSSGSGNAASITGGVTLLSELDLQTPLADAEIASAATWNAKLGGAVAIGQVAFGTAAGVIGGDNGLFWDNVNKRLGVGVTSPAEKFHVFGGAAAIRIHSTTNESSLKYNNSTTTAAIKLANNDLKIELGSSEVIRFLAGGNVGIGTTSPTARLHVQAPGALSSDIAFRVRNSADTGDIIRAQGDGSVFIGLGAGDNTLTLNPQSSGSAIVINNGGYIKFGTTVYARGTSSAFSILDNSFTSRMNITWGGGTSSFNIQGNFVFGAATANASAMLQVDSTTRGFLPPRMTTVQRDAIASPVAGLIVYDTTLNLLHFFNGTIWVSL